jgi:hypothetical protein
VIILVTKIEFEETGSNVYSTFNCPECESLNIHPIAVSVLRGHDETTIQDYGIIINEVENKGRGSVITLEYACEHGHHGRLRFIFCKGETETFHETLHPFQSNSEWRDIWRD